MSARPAFALLLVLLVAACSSGGEPDAIRQGRSIYGDTCSVCHGDSGQGGVGPSLDSVVEIWPDCADQIRWIELGSEGWKLEVGNSYGATGEVIEGVMPGQAENLSTEEIAIVAAFERHAYGGSTAEAALTACGVD